MNADTRKFFLQLWENYVQIAPQAGCIHDLFTSQGERIVNDHVAFRTYDRYPLDIETLEPLLLGLGYRRHAPYEFPEKGLTAWSYLPADPDDPRIFLSALRVATLSRQAQCVVEQLVAQVDATRVVSVEVFAAGRLWEMPAWETYRSLLTESEYAAWVAVMGIRPNHFTISVNALRRWGDVQEVVRVLKQNGFPINDAGGEIKGSPEALLEQASTLADRVNLEFADGDRHEVPSCYYEFARRYLDADGRLYQGFVASSADRLFEATRA